MPRAKSQRSRRQRWTAEQARTVLEKQAASGLAMAHFAEREGLDPARLYRWRQRLGIGAGQRAVVKTAADVLSATFVEVKAARPGRVELVLRSGHVLFVPESFDSGALGRLVEILERAAEC